jgi:hypothetical protein
MTTLEITVQRRSGDGWPVVALLHSPWELPVRKDGILTLDEVELRKQLSPEAYGRLLGQALFRDQVRDAFTRAQAKSDDFLRVLLFVEDPSLRRLRWERLCAPLEGGWRLLRLDQRVPFSLYLPSLTDRRYPAIGRADLRVLLLAASPKGLDEYGLKMFDVKASVTSTKAACGEIPCDVLAALDDALGPPTLEALCERITAGAYTILHLICHGAYDRSGEETLIFLAADNGNVDPVPATRLLQRLESLRGGKGLPQLAFLSTCHSAKPEGEGALGGLAQRLVRDLGMPAVVAMTDRITVRTATDLASSFYQRIRVHGQVDLALTEATIRLAERGDVTVPTLFSRLGDRPLFSDTLERPLTPTELEQGLMQLGALLGERAPTLLPELERLAGVLRATHGADPSALSAEAAREREEAVVDLERVSTECTDLSFKALALGQQPPTYDPQCPFRGLYPFRVEDQEFFFGREDLVNKLHHKLIEDPFLPVLGESGSGKSSVVLAGLVPKLRRNQPDLGVEVITPGADALDRLERAVSDLQAGDLLVVDQFEELFTHVSPEAQAPFVEGVLGLVDRHRVVITMRADFWGRCGFFPRLAERMLARQELITPMNADELRSAMEQQAIKVGLYFEADLANTILDDVEGEPGAMPLLQHALRELWRRRRGRWLRAAEYRAVGGVRQAIARTADHLYERLDAANRERMRDILIGLTQVAEVADPHDQAPDTRQRVWLEELVPAGQDPASTEALVRQLADARLVVTGRNKATGKVEVEVAHEALIRYWPRLRGWVDEDRTALRLRDEVRRAAREWNGNQHEQVFLIHRGRRLDAARALPAEHRVSLGQLEVSYLQACGQLQDQELAREQAERRMNLAETGWGVIFASDADPAIRDALRELLEHRRSQASLTHERRYREFFGDSGYQPGETRREFLQRHRVGTGPPDPDVMPFYLLIVGDPESIPFSFQQQLDVQYAVGRIHFDTLDEYARYARSVVAAESTGFSSPKTAVFAGVTDEGNTALKMGSQYLVDPLVDRISKEFSNWVITKAVGEDAKKERIREYLGGAETPAFLFVISHGMGYPYGDSRQRSIQGALVCQDWSGDSPIDLAQACLSADDIREDARLLGLVAFLFASYGAGTPRFAVPDEPFAEPAEIAPHAFLGRLPQRLLAHEHGGALAVIGQVERGWLTSFWEQGDISNVGTFVNMVRRLLAGHTVGSAMEFFNQRYADLSSAFVEELQLNDPESGSQDSRTRLWLTMNDARDYVVLGDPAVRLVTGMDAASRRPVIEPVSLEPGTTSGPELLFNGINAASGDYLLDKLSAMTIAAVARRADPFRIQDSPADLDLHPEALTPPRSEA